MLLIFAGLWVLVGAYALVNCAFEEIPNNLEFHDKYCGCWENENYHAEA